MEEIQRLQQIFLQDKNFNNFIYVNNFKFSVNSTENIIEFVNIFSSKIISKFLQDFEKTKSFDEIFSCNNYPFIFSTFKAKIWEEKGYEVPDDEIVLNILKNCYFKYKFGNLNSFWKENLLNFFFKFDRETIESDEELSFLFENMANLLDFLDDVLYKIENIYNIDKVDDEFLNYTAELFGLHKQDLSLTIDNQAFRSLLKNIKTLYQLKGSKKVFFIFFNLLGFDVNIKEFYFDRDKYFTDDTGFFNERSLSSIYHYLTPISPEKRPEYPVANSWIQNTKDIHLLDTISLDMMGITTDGNILGVIPCPFKRGGTSYYYLPLNDNQYRYFKTNLISFTLSSKNKNLTSESSITINKYIKFFYPINLILDLRISVEAQKDFFSDAVNIFKFLNVRDTNVETQNYSDFVRKQQLSKYSDEDNVKYNLLDENGNPLPYQEALNNVINICAKLLRTVLISNNPFSEQLKFISAETFGTYLLRNGLLSSRIHVKKHQNDWFPREGDYIEKVFFRTLTKMLAFENVFCCKFKEESFFDVSFSAKAEKILNCSYNLELREIYLPEGASEVETQLFNQYYYYIKNFVFSSI